MQAEFFIDISFQVWYTCFMIKCILFDRDGTLGELQDKRYPQTLKPYADIPAFFSLLHEKGYLVGIITNQSSIARGTGAGYDFDAEFTAYGADIWEICPHDDNDKCDCRKPKSGLLYAVCKRLCLRPNECLVVGDRVSDMICAKNAGADAILVRTGYGEREMETARALYPEIRICERFDKILDKEIL